MPGRDLHDEPMPAACRALPVHPETDSITSAVRVDVSEERLPVGPIRGLALGSLARHPGGDWLVRVGVPATKNRKSDEAAQDHPFTGGRSTFLVSVITPPCAPSTTR